MSMVEFSNVSFSYEADSLFENSESKSENKEVVTKNALSDLSLSINDGEFVAILGHNGSGKSTVAKLMNALILPSEGMVHINGMNTNDSDKVWEIRKTAGMVFQNPDNQMIANVIEEDVAFGPENLGIPPEEIRKAVDFALNAVEMGKYRKKAPSMLSGGQKQRVAIAGILAMKPSLIILDEPTAMLDPSGRKEVIDTIRRLNKEENLTIVLITHFMEEAVLADRIMVINDGRKVMEGNPKQVFSDFEKLKSIGLDVPQVTEAAHLLKQHGINFNETILTVEELVGAICHYK